MNNSLKIEDICDDVNNLQNETSAPQLTKSKDNSIKIRDTTLFTKRNMLLTLFISLVLMFTYGV